MVGTSFIEPFSYRQRHQKTIASGSSTNQIARMPWQSPVQRTGKIKRLAVSNPVGTAGYLSIWDQDNSNTTPPTTGSAGDALLLLEIGASGASGVAVKTTVYAENDLMDRVFVAGINAQSTLPGVKVMCEVEYI